MLRAAQRAIHSRQRLVCQHVRLQSQQVGGQRKAGGGATGVLVALTGVTAGFAGVIGYASWSDENRKVIDNSIPGIQLVTDAILGKAEVQSAVKQPQSTFVSPTPVAKSPAPAPVKKEPKKDQDEGLLQKKIEREKKKEEHKEEKSTPSVAPPASKAEPVVQKQSADKPKSSPPSITTTTTAATPTASVTLEAAIKDANRSMTDALQAAEEAAEVVSKQVLAAVKDMNSGKVSDSLKATVGSAVTSAEDALDKAQISLNKLSSAITDCKNEPNISTDTVSNAEQTACELAPAITKVHSVVSDAINSLLTFETLTKSLSEAKENLSAELKTLLPGVTSLDIEKQLQLMLGQAYLKVLTLQKHLSEKQRAIDELRERTLMPQTAEARDLQEELDKLRHQLMLQHKSDLSRQKEELEAEVRGQLKRQAAAHSEHLGDMLLKKEQEVTKVWQAKLFDEIIKEKDRHLNEIAAVKGKVEGLKIAVDARADAESSASSARRLWLACNSLRNALRLGKEGASNFDEQLEPLEKHIAAIMVAGVDDEFVQVIVGNLKGVASNRGVFTEEALRHRFQKVASISRRVALVPENGGSLLRYLLSYVQSMLIVEASPKTAEAMLFDEPVDIDSLNTFDIIDRARICLIADDLIGCVRWLNQLTGESRNVARDWCLEARRTLEARQAADALMAHAAAITARAM